MDCKKVNEYINPFLNDELSDKSVVEMLRHLEECPQCRKETEIYFMVREADRLIDVKGEDNYNLKQAFYDFLESKKRFLRKRTLYRVLLLVMAVLVSAAIYLAVKEWLL